MIERLLFLIFILLTASCKQTPFEGFKELPGGILYKIHTIGDLDKNPKTGDFITVKIITEAVSYNTAYYRLKRNWDGTHVFQLKEKPAGIIPQLVSILNKGDSATFAVRSSDIFSEMNLPECRNTPEYFKMSIKLLDTKPEAEFKKTQAAFNSWQAEPLETEQTMLDNYLKENMLNIAPEKEGIYIIEQEKGSGSSPVNGNAVYVNYTGKFLNGEEFDNTYITGEPLDFTLGTGQVIKGMEAGIKKMKEGGKARLIIPSELAFGKKGSSTGIVPPNTALIYDLELIKIKK